MFLILIKKYWFEIVIAMCILFTLGYIKYLDGEIADRDTTIIMLEGRVKENQAYILAQNISIATNRADYQAAMERLPTVLHEIETRYKTETIPVIQWRDHNVTHDCNSSMQYINAFVF